MQSGVCAQALRGFDQPEDAVRRQHRGGVVQRPRRGRDHYADSVDQLRDVVDALHRHCVPVDAESCARKTSAVPGGKRAERVAGART